MQSFSRPMADVAEPFRQRFRRQTRQGNYVLHFAQSGDQADRPPPVSLFFSTGMADTGLGLPGDCEFRTR